MAWSWSHSSEAYDNAQFNLAELDRDTRNRIATEWIAVNGDGMMLDVYDAVLPVIEEWGDERLNDFIWERMSDEAGGRICENGGHQAWCCPFGCGFHLVNM